MTSSMAPKCEFALATRPPSRDFAFLVGLVRFGSHLLLRRLHVERPFFHRAKPVSGFFFATRERGLEFRLHRALDRARLEIRLRSIDTLSEQDPHGREAGTEGECLATERFERVSAVHRLLDLV